MNSVNSSLILNDNLNCCKLFASNEFRPSFMSTIFEWIKLVRFNTGQNWTSKQHKRLPLKLTNADEAPAFPGVMMWSNTLSSRALLWLDPPFPLLIHCCNRLTPELFPEDPWPPLPPPSSPGFVVPMKSWPDIPPLPPPKNPGALLNCCWDWCMAWLDTSMFNFSQIPCKTKQTPLCSRQIKELRTYAILNALQLFSTNFQGVYFQDKVFV